MKRSKQRRSSAGVRDVALPAVDDATKAAIAAALDRLEGITPEQRRRSFGRFKKT